MTENEAIALVKYQLVMFSSSWGSVFDPQAAGEMLRSDPVKL